MAPVSTARTAALAAVLLSVTLPGCDKFLHEGQLVAQDSAAKALANRASKKAADGTAKQGVARVAASAAAHSAATDSALLAERRALRAAGAEARPGLAEQAARHAGDELLGRGVDAAFDRVLAGDARKDDARTKEAR